MDRIKSFLKSGKKTAFALAIIFISLIACEKYIIEGPEKPENVSFKDDIIPIFTKNCVSCHGGGIAPNLKPESAYNSLNSGGYFSTANPASSEIYTKLLNSSSHQSKSTPEEEIYILTWIEEGAKNN